MDGMTELELPGLPGLPWREYDLVGTLERPEGTPPPAPLTYAAVVEAVHTAHLSQWTLRIRAGSAGTALATAELVLPEAAGARWSVIPAGSP
jgi:hypothetical protein